MGKETDDKQKRKSDEVLTKSHHHSYVSQSGLSAVLKSVKENGMPDGVSRSTIKRKRDASLPDGLFVKKTVPCKDSNEPAEVWLVHPILLLQHLAATKPSVADLLASVLRQDREFLKITVYTDEVLPGNQLKPRNDRKLISFYWSFTDFSSALSSEDIWLHVCSIRANVARNLEGGWSRLFHLVVMSFFSPPYDVSKGIMLDLKGHDPVMIKAKIGQVIGDEAALQGCWSFKGASGTMCCFLCRNITLDRLEVAKHDQSGHLLSHTCLDLGRIKWQTDASIQECVQLLKRFAGTVTQQHFNRMQQSVGINFEPNGALFSDDLDGLFLDGPVSVTHYDWMHCYVVSGIWNTEAGYFLETIKAITPVKSIHQFLKGLTWPKTISSRGMTGKTCLVKHEADGSEVKCSASEALSVFPAFRLFVLEKIQDGVSPEVDLAKRSFLALCQVLDLLSSRQYNKETLQDAIMLHLTCRLRAYGASKFQPKCHYAVHLPFFLAESHQLQACWVHERKHKELKRFATDASNANLSRGWELGLLKQAVLSQLNGLDEANFIRRQRLGASKPVPSDLAGHVRALLQLVPFVPATINMSNQCFLEGERQVWALDIVLMSDPGGAEQVGEVWFFVSVNDTPQYVCWCPFDTLGNNRFRRKDTPLLQNVTCLKRSLIYVDLEDAIVLVAP